MIVLLLVYSMHVYQGLPAYKPRDEADVQAYYVATLQTAEAEMGRLYSTALQRMQATKHTPTAQQLSKQQETWKKLAADQCTSETALFEGGTMMATLKARCMICQTRLRTLALEHFLDVVMPEDAAERAADRAAWRKNQPPLCDE